MLNKVNIFSRILLLFVCLISFSFFALASSEANSSSEEHTVKVEGTKETSKEGFNAGETIMEHIADSHFWHLWGDHEHAVSIPLPIIVYTDKGIDMFSSSNVEHHGQIYKGTNYNYILNHDKVEIVNENGQLNESATASIIDFSITKNVIAIFISIAFILFIFISSAKSYASRKNKAPKGIQSVIEPFIILIRDEVAKPNIGDRYEKFMPFLLTLFFFIWINNLLGIIPFFPGGANVTGNISVALTLGLFAFIITTFSTNIHYWTHIINTPGVPWWLKFPVPLMPIVELIGVVSKPVVLTLRLFANITAGHIIILSFICLIFIFGKGGEAMGAGLGVSVASVLFSVFMDVMELLVAFLQAYVFTLLSAIYFGGAKVEHHHEEHH